MFSASTRLVASLTFCCLALLGANNLSGVEASTMQRTTIASASIPTSRQSRSYRINPVYSTTNTWTRRSRAIFGRGDTTTTATMLAARRSNQKQKATVDDDALFSDNLEQTQQEPVATSYRDLPLLGKVVAGVVEVAVVTVLDYVQGFCGGYFLGSIVGLPGLALGKNSAGAATFWEAASQRFGKMHQRSFRWASTWAGVSAAVGGINVAARVVRGGVEDEWTSVMSSMAMGAYFFRDQGAMGMLKGAIMYGATVKLFNSSSSRKQDAPALYEDETIVVDP